MALFLPQRTRLERALEAVARDEWKVQAFAYLRPSDELREEAGLSDERHAAGRALSPLDGMPVGVKDLIDTAGIFTECGSRAMNGRLPERDAEAVRRLRAAGCILMGKLRTHEFGLGTRTPPTRNAVDSERSPGGSSGGSAAAVAAGFVEGALGTDTGGSIRIPASYNGCAGLVPTPGIVSLEGVFPVAPSLDRCGPLGPDVATVEALLRAIGDLGGQEGFAGAAPGAAGAWALPARPLRVGVPRRWFCEDVQEPVGQGFDYALDVLRDAGWELVEVDVPSAPRTVDVQLALLAPEAWEVHRELLAERGGDYTDATLGYLELGSQTAPERRAWAEEQRELVRAEVAAALAGVDLVATPATPFTAPPHDAYGLDMGGVEMPLDLVAVRNTAAFSQAGVPSLVLPCAADGDGLPIGLQLVAAPRCDLALLAAAAQVERLLGEALG